MAARQSSGCEALRLASCLLWRLGTATLGHNLVATALNVWRLDRRSWGLQLAPLFQISAAVLPEHLLSTPRVIVPHAGPSPSLRDSRHIKHKTLNVLMAEDAHAPISFHLSILFATHVLIG